MAHEAGHVVARHSARAMVQAYGLEAIAKAALGEDPGTVGQIATALVGGGVQLAHSRSQETEADEYGARYTTAVNYDPRGLVSFFQKLQAQEGQVPGFLKWLSTHPASAERVQYLNQYIAKNRLGGTDVGADRLSAIKQRLKK
jgi:predicted Zn-dependent protease